MITENARPVTHDASTAAADSLSRVRAVTAWHLNPVHSYAVTFGVAALILALMMWLGRPRGRVTPNRFALLFGLRLSVLLLLLLILLRPTLVVSDVKSHTARITLMLDRSRSMGQADELNGATRWESMTRDLRGVADILDELAKQYQLEFVLFDEQTQPAGAALAEVPLNAPPTGKTTALGAALEDVLRRAANIRQAAVLLFSDGAQQALPPRDQAPQSPARRLNDLNTPLYTVTYGQDRAPKQNRDLAVIELLASPTVYVKNVLTVTATVRATGMTNQIVQVKLLYETEPGKEEIVGGTTLTPTEDGQLLPLELSFVPDKPGERKLTLVIEGPNGVTESTLTNNRLSTFVTVLEGGINLFYVEAESRVESRFLRRSLNEAPDMQLDYQWVDGKQMAAKRQKLSLAEQVKPDKYKCYILGDIGADLLRNEDLQAIADNVERGAGLILLGGYHAYWAGGFQDTPLARVMPLQYDAAQDRLLRQNYGEPIRKDLHLPGPLQLLPDGVLGRGVPFLKLGPADKNEALWKQLPPLKGANRWRAMKPAAKVLARSSQGDPLIAALEPGQGRVLALAGDSTWTWAMQGFTTEHRTFWRQAVLWTLKIDESDAGSVWLSLDQRRVMPGRRVGLTAGVRGGSPEVAEQAKFTARVTLPDGKQRPINLGPQDGVQAGGFGETALAGEYQIEVTAEHEGKTIGTAKGRFIVLSQDLELDNPLARPGVMAGLARMTADVGGAPLQRDELRGLLEKLRDDPPKFEVETQTKHTPWDRPEVFLTFVGLLILEWFLRKKWGLV